jgi:BlaI family transcriptional regulator, penicillinase repressor
MARDPKARPLTRLELEIMKALWGGGPGTVEAVRERLPAEPRLAYTTVQTMLNVLFRKGKVKRKLAGRAYEYRPVVSRAKAARVAIRDLIDRLFGGSAESLVMNLVETRELTPETLSRLNKILKESEAIRREKEARHGDD